MPSRKPRRRGYILKHDRAAFDEPSGSNGAVLTVEYSRLRTGVGYPALKLPHLARLLRDARLWRAISCIPRILGAHTYGCSKGKHPGQSS
jgi:hypothetical protein